MILEKLIEKIRADFLLKALHNSRGMKLTEALWNGEKGIYSLLGRLERR